MNRSTFFYTAGLVLLCWLLFGKTIGFDFVKYDDPAYITENGYVNNGLSLEGVKWAFFLGENDHELMHVGVKNIWHPLTWISHMIDVTLFGIESAAGHHATNVLLHSLCGLLIFFIGKKLGLPPLASLFGAVLFLIHPTKAESVAWVSERKDVLSGFFFFAAFLAGLSRRTVIGILLFILALMSKPSTVVLPPLLILSHLWLQKKDILSIKAWFDETRKWIPWIAFAVVGALITISLQANGTHQEFMGSIPLKYRLLSLPLNFFTYWYRLLVPVNLSFHYEPTRLNLVILATTFLLLAFVIAWVLKTRIRWRDFSYGILAFVLCWLPVSGILYVGTSFTADRYLYLSAVIPFLLIAKHVFLLKWTRYVGVVVIAVFSILCWRQLDVWKDTESLFTHGTKAQPNDPTSWGNLGVFHAKQGHIEKAMSCYKQALKLNSLEYFTWHNLGNLYAGQKRYDEALESYTSGIEASPTSLFIYRSKGKLLQSLERYQEASETFQQAVNVSKRLSATELMLLTETQFQLDNISDAKETFRSLQSLNSQDPTILAFQARVLDAYRKIEAHRQSQQ